MEPRILGILKDRKVEIEVGEQGGQGQLYTSESRFRLEFNARYDSSGEPPKGSIEIYNPPQELAGKLRSLGTKAYIRVAAGYGVAATVFAGSPIRDEVKLDRSGQDWVLKVQANSGGEAYRRAIARVSIPGNVGFETFVRQAAEEAGVKIGELDLTAAPSTLPRGVMFEGPASRLLEQAARMARCQIVYTGTQINFVRSGKGLSGGVVEVPLVGGEGNNLFGDPTETDKGLKFKMPLTPSVMPGRQLVVKYVDRFINQMVERRVVAREVTHKGGTHSDEFDTEVLGRIIK